MLISPPYAAFLTTPLLGILAFVFLVATMVAWSRRSRQSQTFLHRVRWPVTGILMLCIGLAYAGFQSVSILVLGEAGEGAVRRDVYAAFGNPTFTMANGSQQKLQNPNQSTVKVINNTPDKIVVIKRVYYSTFSGGAPLEDEVRPYRVGHLGNWWPAHIGPNDVPPGSITVTARKGHYPSEVRTWVTWRNCRPIPVPVGHPDKCPGG
jgi:hypothetical protein